MGWAQRIGQDGWMGPHAGWLMGTMGLSCITPYIDIAQSGHQINDEANFAGLSSLFSPNLLEVFFFQWTILIWAIDLLYVIISGPKTLHKDNIFGLSSLIYFHKTFRTFSIIRLQISSYRIIRSDQEFCCFLCRQYSEFYFFPASRFIQSLC